jgi:hypothetical protein
VKFHYVHNKSFDASVFCNWIGSNMLDRIRLTSVLLFTRTPLKDEVGATHLKIWDTPPPNFGAALSTL